MPAQSNPDIVFGGAQQRDNLLAPAMRLGAGAAAEYGIIGEIDLDRCPGAAGLGAGEARGRDVVLVDDERAVGVIALLDDPELNEVGTPRTSR